MTFSITGFDSTGKMGVAVATRYWAVGARVPYVRPGIAALAVQAYAQPYIGYDVLNMMESDPELDGPTALQAVLDKDPGKEWRQVGLVDVKGNVQGFTGKETVAWSGHATAADCVGAGNMLVGQETVEAMTEFFGNHANLDLPERLAGALQAGHFAGGDKRGQQSAAVYVVDREESPYLDLRIDDDPDAIAALMRLVQDTRDVELVRSAHFSRSRESPTVASYIAHRESLREEGLA